MPRQKADRLRNTESKRKHRQQKSVPRQAALVRPEEKEDDENESIRINMKAKPKKRRKRFGAMPPEYIPNPDQGRGKQAAPSMPKPLVPVQSDSTKLPSKTEAMAMSADTETDF